MISALRRRRRLAVAVAGLTALVTGLFIALAAPSSARRGGLLHEGAGFAIGDTDFVGYYLAHGTKVYCLSPRKSLPSTITLSRTERYGRAGRVRSYELAYALARWGDASSDFAAAVESQVLNTIVGNTADVARRARSIPAGVATAVRRHLALTRRFRGPYVTDVRVDEAVLPGRSGRGTVTVTAASGRRMPGTTILLTGSDNALLPHRVRTGSAGVGRFTYRVTDVGEVHLHAAAVDLPSTALRASSPAPSEQHMVTWAAATASRASTGFASTPSGFAHRYTCTTTCDGRPTTTVSACAPASTLRSRLVVRAGGRTLTLRFPRSTARVCERTTTVLSDGVRVSASWQYLTRHGWSRPVDAAGGFTVDCPAVPPVAVTMTYDCAQATVTIGLAHPGVNGSWTPLVNPGRHRMVLVISGAVSRRIVAAHGRHAVFTASAACGSPVTYTAQAGVQRSDGGWNYGPQARVTTPGSPTLPG